MREIIFITQIVKDRKPAFQNPALVQLLLTTFEEVNKYHPFTILAYVILPDHFHGLIEPTGQSNFSQIMHSLKSNFTKTYKKPSIFKIPYHFGNADFGITSFVMKSTLRIIFTIFTSIQ